ncbi:flavohemoglobin expression-modulating QEGLA motif protein [Paracrocinitomix mangrovi]|uniref:flavohemoglobin expression-modulating QEGLA motif protein n=1 Tax=Paracrocinitomix mangrovi TaxID=2862509 RepID=UPI001C8E81DB|nr:flavohemoglobin expression-modulating QEGLA motif protein [Paracrocinitomix mangrovi]UKN03203.1 flavohemoglobin expression-modulating QEGLA motif protein [Paracrocinitomix mangrovi]
MHKYSIEQIIQKIEKGHSFEAEDTDGSLYIKITEYVPYVCTAIHDGHNFRSELLDNIIHSDYERWYEEDPKTLDFISSFPIVIAGKDSRFEYDLNRPPETAVYKDAWGKPVWKKPLTERERETSLSKHTNFYRVIHALVTKLEKLFKASVVYDIHSYNYKRHKRQVPVFNIGTANINRRKYAVVKNDFLKGLASIEIPHVKNITAENDVFQGNGYLLKYVTEHFDNTLVLATEVSKVYCDEETGEYFSQVIDSIREGFKRVILENALLFTKKHSNLKVKNSNLLLSSELDEAILKVDKMLYKLVRNFEVLKFVNPINIEAEKKKFIKSKGLYKPQFKYKHLNLNPFLMKRKLMNLPVEQIQDVNIQNLYKGVINAYCDKIELIASIGTENFLYNSLRYFGEPTKKDIANAQFILHFNHNAELNQPMMNDTEALSVLKKELKSYEFECKIKLSDKLAAKAMVVNSEKTLYLKKGGRFTEKEIHSLVHHEIGVHMVTTMNADSQPIKLFSMGMPVNTKTQEGLAIMSEYYSNTLTVKRLKELSLRVVGISSMIHEHDFNATANMLVNEYGMSLESAFYLTTRIFRGGGFTKDYLYLSGLKEVSTLMKSDEGYEDLMVGKTHHNYLGLINEMIDRKLIIPPRYSNPAYQHNLNDNPLIDYIIENIQE